MFEGVLIRLFKIEIIKETELKQCNAVDTTLERNFMNDFRCNASCNVLNQNAIVLILYPLYLQNYLFQLLLKVIIMKT